MSQTKQDRNKALVLEPSTHYSTYSTSESTPRPSAIGRQPTSRQRAHRSWPPFNPVKSLYTGIGWDYR